MGITYATEGASLQYIYTYDASAGTYSANQAGQAAHGYFPDDADVGDCIYFGSNFKFINLTFNIGTPLAATAITVAWEFLNAYQQTWDALPGLTDGTNAFQNSGSKTVAYQSPRLWAPGYTYFRPAGLGVDRFWIRARITAATAVTEGGANITTAVAATLARITVTGTYSDLLPSLYTADVAGGWGVFERVLMPDATGYEYILGVPLLLGDGSTATTVTISKRILHLMSGASVSDTANTSGTVADMIMVMHWCALQSDASNLVSLTYSSLARVVFIAHPEDAGGYGDPGLTHNGTTADGVMSMHHQFKRWGGDVYGIGMRLYGTTRDLVSYAALTSIGGDSDRIRSHYKIGLPTTYATQIARNVMVEDTKFKGTDSCNSTKIIFENLSSTTGLDVGNPALFEAYLPEKNSFYLTYYFRLQVLDEDGLPLAGVTVAIENAQDSLNYGFDYTTGADGSGPLITDGDGVVGPVLLIAHKHWREPREGAWLPCNTTLAYSPYAVTLSKDGYETRTIEYTIDRQRDDIEMLGPATGGGGGGGPIIGSRIVRGLGAV